eukprot:13990960-Ditylum_brightwellii.AAC.2
MMLQFECNKLGKMDKYMGYKVDRDWTARAIKLMQPVPYLPHLSAPTNSTSYHDQQLDNANNWTTIRGFY